MITSKGCGDTMEYKLRDKKGFKWVKIISFEVTYWKIPKNVNDNYMPDRHPRMEEGIDQAPPSWQLAQSRRSCLSCCI